MSARQVPTRAARRRSGERRGYGFRNASIIPAGAATAEGAAASAHTAAHRPLSSGFPLDIAHDTREPMHDAMEARFRLHRHEAGEDRNLAKERDDDHRCDEQ